MGALLGDAMQRQGTKQGFKALTGHAARQLVEQVQMFPFAQWAMQACHRACVANYGAQLAH